MKQNQNNKKQTLEKQIEKKFNELKEKKFQSVEELNTALESSRINELLKKYDGIYDKDKKELLKKYDFLKHDNTKIELYIPFFNNNKLTAKLYIMNLRTIELGREIYQSVMNISKIK